MILAIAAVLALIACFGLIIFWALRFLRPKSLGILASKQVYSDSDNKPGVRLYSDSVNLAGKPDYIVKNKDGYIPVEVKTTNRIPKEPYQNHVMQLMSYCLLVEENYGKAPVGGYLKYVDSKNRSVTKEFKLLYTDEAKQAVIDLVERITDLKISGQELKCNHLEHNRASELINF